MSKKNDLLLQIIIFGLTSCMVALLVIKLYPEWYFVQQKVVASEKNKKVLEKIENNLKEIKNETPLQIIIPSINVDLPVAPGVISDEIWTLYDDKAAWLSTSKSPGLGNVIIYAHNRDSLFGNLHTLSNGAAIAVSTNKNTYLYSVRSKSKVLPTNIEAILSDNNQLSLYTCEGFLDELRTLVTADYVGIL